MEIIAFVIVFIIIIAFAVAYGAMSWGLVMYKFWYWFLLPVFPSLPQINYIQALGLAVFIGLFHTVQSQVIKEEYKDETRSMALSLLAPWVTLMLGWLIHVVIR